MRPSALSVCRFTTSEARLSRLLSDPGAHFPFEGRKDEDMSPRADGILRADALVDVWCGQRRGGGPWGKQW